MRRKVYKMKMKIENGGEQMAGGCVNEDGLKPLGVLFVIGCGCLQRRAAVEREMTTNSEFNLKGFGE